MVNVQVKRLTFPAAEDVLVGTIALAVNAVQQGVQLLHGASGPVCGRGWIRRGCLTSLSVRPTATILLLVVPVAMCMLPADHLCGGTSHGRPCPQRGQTLLMVAD